MNIYNVYQSGKRLYIDEKENPDNKIVVNKYESEQTTLRLISDGTLPPRLYWALRNPKLSQKYFILKLVNNEDLIVGTDISATHGLWDMLLIGTDEDYVIEGTDIDQSRLTYVSDHFGRLFVRDNFLEELDFEEQCSPTFRIFYDEIMFQLGNKAETNDIPDQLSDLENDVGFISGVTAKDDGEGNVTIVGTTFSGSETENGGGYSNIEVDDELDEKSTNPVQNLVVTKEIKELHEKDESLDDDVNALKERNAELEATIEKLAIKPTTEESDFLHITDSADYKVLDMGMSGITEQKTTEGKNYYSGGDISGTQAVSLTIDTIPAGTYTISANVESSDTDATDCLMLFYTNSDISTRVCTATAYINRGNNVSKTITLTSDTTYVTFYASASNIMSIDDTFSFTDIQIEPGETATDCEVYTGQMASPNPDYPQEIVNAGVMGKNLFDLEKAKDESNYVWGVIYPYFPIYVGAGNTFTFSCKLPTETTYSLLIFDAVDGNLIRYIWHFSNSAAGLRNDVITVTSPNDYIYIRVSTDVVYWLNDFTDIQIELGDTATDYESYGYKIGCVAGNKNLFDETNKVTNTASANYDFAVDVICGNTYTLSASFNNTSGIIALRGFTDDDDTSGEEIIVLKGTSGIGRNSKTSVVSKKYHHYAVRVYSYNSEYSTDIQLELDASATDYTPHQSQAITLTSPVQLTKWDTLVNRDGVWGWSIWHGSTDDIASLFEAGAIYGSEGAKYMTGCSMTNANLNYNANNIYSEVGVQPASACVLYQPRIYSIDVNIPIADDDTVETAKEHLHYKMIWLTSTEQTFIPLPDEEQELLNNLTTYYGVTNIWNEQGCPMWIRYYADTQLYVNNKLETINNALLSLGANV